MLDQSLVATRDGLQETRRALKALRASPLDDLGLLLALRKLSEEAAARANLHLELGLPRSLPALPTTVEQCLYRVAQEAIANVVHHANAHTLRVHLAHEDAHIVLTVQDDGLGFDARSAEQAGHYGVAGMRERAAMIGGHLEVQTAIDYGTIVVLTVPLQRPSAARTTPP